VTAKERQVTLDASALDDLLALGVTVEPAR
jgi:hypothetical protein